MLMLPEMLIFGGGLVVLIGGSFLPRHKQWWARLVAAAVLVAAGAVAVIGMAAPDQAAFEGTLPLTPPPDWRGLLPRSAC